MVQVDAGAASGRMASRTVRHPDRRSIPGQDDRGWFSKSTTCITAGLNCTRLSHYSGTKMYLDTNESIDFKGCTRYTKTGSTFDILHA